MPPTPPPPPAWRIPKFDLHVEDLAHPGVAIFFDSVNPLTALKDAAVASFEWLYTPGTAPTHIEKITLVLQSMEGVANTSGEGPHRKIVFSLDYILKSSHRAKDEILGVLTHEMVHCYQYDAEGTCPGGLIEGIADYVRLHAGFVPPHWKREAGERWDAGYQTTGYFLDWIELHRGPGTIKAINGRLKVGKYREKIFEEVTGNSVGSLWKSYRGFLGGRGVTGVGVVDQS